MSPVAAYVNLLQAVVLAQAIQIRQLEDTLVRGADALNECTRVINALIGKET